MEKLQPDHLQNSNILFDLNKDQNIFAFPDCANIIKLRLIISKENINQFKAKYKLISMLISISDDVHKIYSKNYYF